MSRLRSLARRIRGDDLAQVRTDITMLREQVTEIRDAVHHLGIVVGQLNHDVRSGSEEGLPLFLGYAERFRTDADTVVGAAVTIDRQLQRLSDEIDRLRGPDRRDDG
ncbi:MAG: hypothetical protein ABWZ42_11660 [Ilumatobacteraceae bacterium]